MPDCNPEDLDAKLVTGVHDTKKTIAHELYHWIKWIGVRPYDGWNKWIIEGSTEHISNIVPPGIQKDLAGSYKSALHIHEQMGNGEYSTSMFFQTMEQTREVANVHQWVMNNTPMDWIGLTNSQEWDAMQRSPSPSASKKYFRRRIF